jgi:hypothetical protein
MTKSEAKKTIIEIMKELTPEQRLTILEPLCDQYRRESRNEVERDLIEFKRKNKIPRLKTDY